MSLGSLLKKIEKVPLEKEKNTISLSLGILTHLEIHVYNLIFIYM